MTLLTDIVLGSARSVSYRVHRFTSEASLYRVDQSVSKWKAWLLTSRVFLVICAFHDPYLPHRSFILLISPTLLTVFVLLRNLTVYTSSDVLSAMVKAIGPASCVVFNASRFQVRP